MWSDNETSEDLFGFKVHADLLIDVIKDDTILPVTIGVFGDWGGGKSSILKIVNNELSGKDDELKDDTLVLYFNGWVFEGYDDAKAALLESIIEKFEQHKRLGPKVKDNVKKLLGSVQWMRMMGFGFKNIALPAAAAYLTGGLSLVPYIVQQFSGMDKDKLVEQLKSDKAEEFLSGVIKTKEEESFTMVREFRDEFNKMIEQSAIKKLVVIIDDLDRCTHDRIIENLEAIKLFLNVDKTAFLIGADPRIVRNAIEYRYRKDNTQNDSNERIVDDYLEKLIQIPYFLPKLSEPEVETYLSMLACKRELDDSNFQLAHSAFMAYREKNRYSVFGISNLSKVLEDEQLSRVKRSILKIPTLVPLIAQSLYGNPRQIKRFLNTYTLRKRLANVASLANFNDAVLAKIMILEYTELSLFRKLFEWQSGQNGFPEELKNLEGISSSSTYLESKSEFERAGFKDWYKPKVFTWLISEPRLSSVDLGDYFWIARDKISMSLSSAGLIPPIVKLIFSELEPEMPGTLTQSLIKEKILPLTDFEQQAFLELMTQMLKRNSKTKRLYDLFHFLIGAKISGASLAYRDALNAIDINDVEPATALAVKEFMDDPDLKDFLPTYFAGKSPAAKAFKLKE